jgi:heterodisulfide reductase subunit A-like polyferredoxin/coenzyme F420-reducing hydrogenase delta subunit
MSSRAKEQKRWGIFLCNCNNSLPIDLTRINQILDLPDRLELYSRLRRDEIHTLKYLAQKEKYQHLLIGCCGGEGFFTEELMTIGFSREQVHCLDLKESCYWPTEEKDRANEKAARLIRAVLETVEVKRHAPETPVRGGNQVVIVADTPLAFPLARKLSTHAKVSLLLEEHSEAFDAPLPFPLPCNVNRGRVAEVQGHLGAFKVVVERTQSIDLDTCVFCMRCIPVCHTQAITAGLRLIDSKCDRCGDCLTECGEVRAIKIPRQDREVLEADQVLFLSARSAREIPARHRRPGLQHYQAVQKEDLDTIAFNALSLIGDFMKPEFTRYDPGICAAGSHNVTGCGFCISVCPYDAIVREGLRIKVEAVSCEGCGACISVCPTSALKFNDPSPEYLYAKMRAMLTPVNGDHRPVLCFHCPNQGRTALQNVRTFGVKLPGNLLPIEVACLRHVSEANMLAAFRMGAAGVALLGCETCPHGERQLLLEKLDFSRLILESFGLGADRLRLFTTDEEASEALTALGRFAAEVPPFPLPWDGHFPDKIENREVISDAIATFLYGTKRDPGRVRENTPFPFAWAEVRAEACTMARACVNVCPTHAFKLDEEKQTLEFRYMSCVACDLCQQACPEKAITLKRDLILEKAAFAYQVMVQDEMVGCLKCGKPYINRKALETIRARTAMLEAFQDTRKDLLLMCPDCRGGVAVLEMQRGWEP